MSGVHGREVVSGAWEVVRREEVKRTQYLWKSSVEIEGSLRMSIVKRTGMIAACLAPSSCKDVCEARLAVRYVTRD